LRKKKLIEIEEKIWDKIKDFANLKRLSLPDALEYLLTKNLKGELEDAIKEK